jgi:hypothetical protein
MSKFLKHSIAIHFPYKCCTTKYWYVSITPVKNCSFSIRFVLIHSSEIIWSSSVNLCSYTFKVYVRGQKNFMWTKQNKFDNLEHISFFYDNMYGICKYLSTSTILLFWFVAKHLDLFCQSFYFLIFCLVSFSQGFYLIFQISNVFMGAR